MLRRALVALCALLLAAPAASAATPDQLSERTATWLERVTGGTIPDRSIKYGLPEEMAIGCPYPGAGCAGLAYPDHLLIRPRYINIVQRAFERGPVGFPDRTVIAVWLHEHLHSPSDIGESEIHEGIVEALAIDLAPAFIATLPGDGGWVYTLRPPGVYQDDVHTVRLASSRATASGWRTRAARRWRIHLWKQDPDTRERLIAEALAP